MKLHQIGFIKDTTARPCISERLAFLKFEKDGFGQGNPSVEGCVDGYTPDGKRDCRYLVNLSPEEIIRAFLLLPADQIEQVVAKSVLNLLRDASDQQSAGDLKKHLLEAPLVLLESLYRLQVAASELSALAARAAEESK